VLLVTLRIQREGARMMGVVYSRCAGLDVHKKIVVVCVLCTYLDGYVEEELHTFLTMIVDLLA
jgi:transposase